MPFSSFSSSISLTLGFVLMAACFGAPPLASHTIRINEVMASNATTIADEDGDYEDWIELYNYGDQPVGLQGWGLSDSYSNPFKWTFPDTSIAPGEHLLVWASRKSRSDPSQPLHTNYAISSSGEEVVLTRPDGHRVDELPPTSLPTDISIGRSNQHADQWFYFDQPTPGLPNTTTAYTGITEPPSFSNPGGFHLQEFDLVLDTPLAGAAIIYTLDGSEPALSAIGGETYFYKNQFPRRPGDNFGSFLEGSVQTYYYNDPIFIRDRSTDPNHLSARTTTWHSTPNYLPNNPIFKGTVVRARVVKDGYLTGPDRTRSYFITPTGWNRYDLPVISLVMDERHMFDYKTGIYTAGINFDDWRQGNPHQDANSKSPANYRNRGNQWEYPANLELWEPSGELMLSQKIGWRIHGGTSRWAPMKSLRIYARGSAWNPSTFAAPLFEDLSGLTTGHSINEFHRLILRNGGSNSRRLMLRDAWFQESARHLELDRQAYRSAIHFINGEFWGVVNIRERLDRFFIASHHGIDLDDVVLLSRNADIEEGTRDDRQSYQDMRTFVTNNDMEDDANFAVAEQQMDMLNFALYKMYQIYIGNSDWPQNNILFWKKRNPEPESPNPSHDGRWRWILQDLDLGFLPDRDIRLVHYNHLERTAGKGTEPPPTWSTELFSGLLANPGFRNLLIHAFAEHIATTFRPERMLGQIHQMFSSLHPYWQEHSARWRWMVDPVNELNTIEAFAHERPFYVRQHIIDFFQLPGISSVDFTTTGDGAGGYQLATILLDDSLPELDAPLSQQSFSIEYFNGLPLTVTAIPDAGSKFVGWKEYPEISSSTLTIDLQGDLTLTAQFEPDEADLQDRTPPPHDLSSGPYTFSFWSEDAPAGTYPPHMIFEQTSGGDPGLAVEMDGFWTLPYDLASRSRINGLGPDGIAFINTANAQDHPEAGFLGSAILALDTRGQDHLQVTWTGGTVTPNNRTYALRLQYRLGDEGPFHDVPGPAEYLRHELAGHQEVIGPVLLPAALEDRPYVQLRWKYYHVSGDSGPRAQLRLDDILVTAGPPDTAVALAFDQELPAAWQSGRPLPALTVRALDADGLTATAFTGAIQLTVQGEGQLLGATEATAVDGVAVFEGLILEGTGPLTLIATSTGLEPAATAPLQSLRLTSLIMPRFLQGEQDADGNNLDRIPFAFRVRLDGLTPGATYRYGNRIVDADDPPEQNGAGNALLPTGSGTDWVRNTNAPRFRPGDLASRHLELTASAEGSWEGWMVTEPTGNARFTPGNTVWVRLLLNDGAGGEDPAHLLTAAEPVQVLSLGTAPGQASAVMGHSDEGARTFAVLHDNLAGEGRPLAAAPVEITGAEVDDRYAAFYETIVATTPGAWGALLPNDLPAGLRRIEHRAFHDASLLSVRTFPNGHPGTVNPGHGPDPLLIDGDEPDIPLFLPGGTADWTDPVNWTSDNYPDGPGQRARIGPALLDDRNVNLRAPVVIGELLIDNAESPFRNRLRDRSSGNTLTFQATEGPALLRVTGTGEGFVEFQVEADVTLASDLRLRVDNIVGSEEHGALRLREAWSGPGGLIKEGDGLATLTGDGKTYTGPTLIQQGTLAVTEPAVPSATPEVRVNPGGQLRLISAGDPGEIRTHTFGGPLILNSLSRGGDVPEGEGEGLLGALRYDPRGGDSHARVTNPIQIAGPSSLHIDGTANTLELTGPLAGIHPVSKSGGGRLLLNGDNAGFTAPITVSTGILQVDGPLGSAIDLGDDTLLSGSGAVGSLTGAGFVAPAATRLTAASVNGLLHYHFLFTRPGSPDFADAATSGNSVLHLTAAEPFLQPLIPLNRIHLHLDHDELKPGDVFRGGFMVTAGACLATAIAAADVNFLTPDPDGTHTIGDTTFSPYAGTHTLVLTTALQTADLPGGPLEVELLEIHVQDPFADTYAAWQVRAFPDPADRADPAVSGP
ncbi:MAG: hypothetical protein EA425_18505, partial [Puniceicoccaceae bacterium]